MTSIRRSDSFLILFDPFWRTECEGEQAGRHLLGHPTRHQALQGSAGGFSELKEPAPSRY